jgi:hypothetical protein
VPTVLGLPALRYSTVEHPSGGLPRAVGALDRK